MKELMFHKDSHKNFRVEWDNLTDFIESLDNYCDNFLPYTKVRSVIAPADIKELKE